MGFYPDNKIILNVNVDTNGMLGKIAKIKKIEMSRRYLIY